jgi:hypothetical protein
MLKVLAKIVAFSVILFVVLYVGMNNTHQIDFRFPVVGVTDKSPIHTTAAILYFAMFVVGLLAGAIITAGGGGGGRKSGGAKDK